MQRRWVKIAIATAVVVIVFIGVIPFFVNADAFRPKVEDELSTSMGRKITLGHLSLSLITGSLVADNISVADDPAFGTDPFLEAKELHIGVAMGQFIFHRQVQITSFTVDSPAIHLIHAKDGKWNFSSLGSAAANPAPQHFSFSDGGRSQDQEWECHALLLARGWQTVHMHRDQSRHPAAFVHNEVSLQAFTHVAGRRIVPTQRHSGTGCAAGCLQDSLPGDVATQAFRSGCGRRC
jgi:hypothetical protein